MNWDITITGSWVAWCYWTKLAAKVVTVITVLIFIGLVCL